MNRTLSLLIVALLAGPGLAFAHGDAAHARKPAAVVKEQKDWGIAGDAKSARRTVEVRMLKKMIMMTLHN